MFYLGRIFVQINRFHSNSTDSAYLIDDNDVGRQHTSERDRDREKEKDKERDFKMGCTKRDREIHTDKKIKCVGVKTNKGRVPGYYADDRLKFYSLLSCP